MPLFTYKAIDKNGARRDGEIEAINAEVAISSLQKRGLVLSSIKPKESEGRFGLKQITLFAHVSNKDVVILSRQIATLFEAQISALRVFKLIGAETENPLLRKSLSEIADDIQGGNTIAAALSKHPKIFSEFYVSMVRAGEESGKLDKTFAYLADYLDRTYSVTSKAKGALVYPAFVMTAFIAVMALMFTVVIPNITRIIVESGQELPIYTKIVIGISNFFVNYGVFLIVIVAVGGFFAWKYIQTEDGKLAASRFRLGTPVVGNLYQKLYLSRIADNMHTMVLSGIPMLDAIEITADVVGDKTYKIILHEVHDAVKSGSSLSNALSPYEEIPGILTQMVKIGEETGELGHILDTLAQFYRREVENAVDAMVDLIEPAMILILGLGVGILLAAVLIPIYNVSLGA